MRLHRFTGGDVDTESVVRELSSKLKNGELVVFPTETVYGLGANALDRTAVLKVFSTKMRPLADPLICHVADVQTALQYMDDRTGRFSEGAMLKLLGEAFWPGPLSIVVKATEAIPLEVTGNTGYAAFRCPDNDVALKLISAAQCPVVAPSANMFGHISPSCAEHVVQEFPGVDIDVIDGGPCQIGVESTVIKVEVSTTNVLYVKVLRRGVIPDKSIRTVLERHYGDDVKVEIISTKYNVEEISNSTVAKPIHSPGLLLSHYAPKCSTYLLRVQIVSKDSLSQSFLGCLLSPSSAVLIDVIDLLGPKRNCFKHYLTLPDGNNSPSCSSVSGGFSVNMSRNCYSKLREAERLAMSDTTSTGIILISDFDAERRGTIAMAVYDRFYRACSGRVADFYIDKGEEFDVVLGIHLPVQ